MTYRIIPPLALILLAACQGPETKPAPDETAGDQFFASLSAFCGKAFSGELVSDDAADADFADAEMVMHVRECSDDKIAIPFHVKMGEEWDRSRTWLITRGENKLRLKHDHRHKDGTSDVLTMYGGDTVEAGTARAQHFITDPESIALFEREGLDASTKNVWTVEVDAADADAPIYAYQLKRTVEGGAPEARLFRVEFDLGEEIAAPPAAWGQK